MQMKYIRFKYAGFVVFEETQTHKSIAKRFPTDEIESAGFVSGTFDKEYLGCHGESTTLNVSSKPNDSEWLYRRLSVYS